MDIEEDPFERFDIVEVAKNKEINDFVKMIEK